MILRAGSFNVNEYRKAIPVTVKLAVVIRQNSCSTDGRGFTVEEALLGGIEFDHDPALINRDYDTDAGDFIPPQLRPDLIFAKRKGQHQEKTTGRKEGAEQTVTTRGSDVGEATRVEKITTSEAIHQAAMASKAGDYPGAAQILAAAPKPPVPAKKIRSAGFQKAHRPLRSGNSFQRGRA